MLIALRAYRQPYRVREMWGERYSRNVIPTEVEGSFSFAVKCRVFDGEKWETPYRGGRCFMQSGGRNKSENPAATKIEGCARNDETGERLVPLVCLKILWGERYSRNVIPTEVEESFSLAFRCRMFDEEKRETPSSLNPLNPLNLSI